MRKLFSSLLALSAVCGAAQAFALEDHAVVIGTFKWILRGNETADQAVLQHYVPSIKIDRQADGTFQMAVSMPPTLAGGVNVTTVYQQRHATLPNELYFEHAGQPGQPKDYLRCFVEPDVNWEGVTCDEVTLHSLNQVPLAQRLTYSKQHYGGTDLDAGMSQAINAISGAQPAGSIKFFSAADRDFPSWVGTWRISYTNAAGQTSAGTMFFDGFTGSFTAGSTHGSISHSYVDGDTAYGDWTIGEELNGFFSFDKTGPGQFSGTWKNFDETEQGAWSGTRLP